jgi:beta-lactamase class A
MFQMPSIKTATTHMKFSDLRWLALATVALALIGFPLLGAAGHVSASMKAHAKLQEELEALAQSAHPGTLGIAVLDLQSGAIWRVNADQPYPMMSVFKAPVAAAVLARIDRGDMSFDQTVTLTRAELGSGPLRDHFHGDRMTFAVHQLLTAAVSQSDNTAVNALIKLVGSPTVVTTFLRAHGIEGMRVDMDEAGIGQIFDGPAPAPTETPKQKLERYQHGYQAFLTDPRNRSTPDAAVTFLHKLWRNELISTASTQYLINLMHEQTVPRRLRAGLPPEVRLADKCGTSYTLGEVTAAYNDIGIMSWPDGHIVIVAAFLTASHASQAERDALFAELAHDIAQSVHP